MKWIVLVSWFAKSEVIKILVLFKVFLQYAFFYKAGIDESKLWKINHTKQVL